MRKGLIVALSLLLVACNPSLIKPGEPDSKPGILTSIPALICNIPNHRCIGVTVTAGVIDPVPDQAFIGPNHVVFFELPTPGYTFEAITASATAVGGAIAAPPSEFTCKVGPMGKIAACVNRNTTAGSGSSKIYKYTIKVKELATALDPFIVNN
jgi:hypothetical protein